MPKHSSGEGYDYERFLEALVSGSSNSHVSIVSNGRGGEKWGRARQESISSVETDDTTRMGGMARGSRHYL